MSELQKPDLAKTGEELLISFYDDKPKLKGLIKSFLSIVNTPVDVIFDILNHSSLNDATGNQLDIIGLLWGEKRGTDNDDNLRKRISLKILQNVADGTPEQMMSILKTASNASKVNIWDHYPNNVTVFLDTYLDEYMKVIGKSISPAGSNFNVLFPPLQDGKEGDAMSPFEYIESSALSDVPWEVPYPDHVNITPSLNPDPTGGTNAIVVSDLNNTTCQSIFKWLPTIDFTKPYFFGMFVRKDIGATHFCRVDITMYRAPHPRHYYAIYFKPSDGTYHIDVATVSNPFSSFNVKDLGNYWFIYGEVTVTSPETISSCVIEFFPAVGTVDWETDLTLIASTTLWEVIFSPTSSANRYKCKMSDGPIIFAESPQQDYFLKDDAGNFIVDESNNNILVTLGTSKIFGNNQYIFSETDDFRIGKPFCEGF